MLKFGGLLLILFLAGCGFTPQGNLVRGLVMDKGAKAFDEGLKNSEWFICEAASVGSIKRRYGVSRSRAKSYNEFCPARVIDILEEKKNGG